MSVFGSNVLSMQQMEVDELDAASALVAFGDLRVARDRAERDIFVLAAHFADLYSIDADAHGTLRSTPGGQRALPLGGEGAPLVWEFAVAEIAAELQMTPASARRLVGDALATRHRLPRLWQRVHDCEVAPWRARMVAKATRDLTRAKAMVVDDNVADYADGRLPYKRFADRVDGEVLAADPEAATAREKRAAEEEFAKVGQTNTHGRKTLYVKSSAAEMIRIDATISYLAEALRALGDTDNEDRRRTKAVLLMANPLQALELMQALRTARSREAAAEDAGGEAPGEGGTDAAAGDDAPGDVPDAGRVGRTPPPAGPRFTPFDPDQVPPCSCRGGRWAYDPSTLLPVANLYLHVHEDTVRAGNGVVRWEGEGPISWAYVRDILGPQARFVVKGVVDPAGMPAVDSYEVPERLREGLHLRTPFDIFPYASSTSRKKQADHTRPFVPLSKGGQAGQTGLHNLGGMTGFHHRIKTHGGWRVEQPFAGIYVWMSPHGSVFVVDNTGTRQIRRPQRTGLTRLDLGPPGHSPPTARLAQLIEDWVA